MKELLKDIITCSTNMKQPVFKLRNVSTIKWWEWLLLKFKKKRISYDRGINGWAIEWKQLFGKIYVLRYYQRPPMHPNCRCVVEIEEE